MRSRQRSNPLPDKRSVVALVMAQIEEDLAVLVAAAKAAHEEATDEQNKAENKYDTRALEASYLARGQSRQVLELLQAKQEFAALRAVENQSTGPIDVGAMLILRRADLDLVYLLGPKAGGMEVRSGATLVTVITPQSPLGRQLLGKGPGDTVVLPGGVGQESLRIMQVW